MSKKTYHDLFWGVFFLIAAGLLVASQLGWLSAGIGFWRWLFTVVLGAALVQSLANLSVGGTVWSVALLALVWAKPLGITNLVPWTILGGALLIQIGLSLLLRPVLKRRHPLVIIKDGKTLVGQKDDRLAAAPSDTDQVVTITTKLGSVTRYVQSADFRLADITLGLGDAKVYFDNTEIQADHAEIHVDGSLGDLDLFIPANWDLHSDLTNFMGDLKVTGTPSSEPGPKVLLTGGFKLGDIKIHYI